MCVCVCVCVCICVVCVCICVVYMCVSVYLIYKSELLATLVEGAPKVPLSIATTPRCRGGRYSIPWIIPLYSCNAER